jgi:hypothetical protein
MGENIQYKRFLPLVILAMSILLQGCKDDVFNPEKVKAAYQDRFPVKNIDPAMDWKMTQQVRVNVSVSEDTGIDYTIRIYDKNPLISRSSAKLLAEGTANNTTVFTTVMDCPSVLTSAFVCRTDAHSRNIVKYVSIQNGQLHAAFGSSPATTRAAWTRSVSIETYSPEKSEAEITAMLSSAEEIRPNTDFQNGKAYKISKDNIYRNKISKDGMGSDNPAIIIIEGSWEPNGNNMTVERGFEFYVIDGGEIMIPDEHTFTLVQSSRFIVYAGGTIKGNDIELTNASGGSYNYNAGTMEIDDFHVSQGGAFYNCGTVRVDEMNFDSGCKFINQGKAYIGKTDSNITIDNGCYLYAEEFVGTLNMGDTSSAEIEDFGDHSNNYNTQITMGDNSMITVLDEAELSQAQFMGPNNEYALVKINKIEDIGNFSSQGNIHYEVKEIDDDITEDIWWEAKFLDAIKNTEGTISKWGESPITIPAGDCTGEGNTPDESGSETPTDPVSYTYVFEDNFPLVGDYDFNDVVLDVETYYHREKKTNHIKRIQLDVTLAAAGASKPLGVGLRITGINKSDIREVKTGGDDSRFQESFNSSYNKFRYNNVTYMEDSDPSVVIPIAGEVHNVFGVEPGEMVNTGIGVTAKEYTYEVIIELTDQTRTEPLFSKDNLDFFICYQYKSMEQRMEVHLYEFWGYGATAAGTIQQENLDLAGNNTWAICVPYGFRYPKETINVSRTDIPEASAYPEFIYWAQDRTQYTEWYEHPVEENVYR